MTKTKSKKTKYCYRCGRVMIKKTFNSHGYNERTGKRNRKTIYFCTNTYCYEHQRGLEKMCPIYNDDGFHQYSHGFFGFFNPHCSGCGTDNSYMG